MEQFDAIYARQSIDKADSISIESQIELCKYETRGKPYRVFTDKGYSGKNTDRPGFRQMYALIRQGAISRIICYKLDRCSRSILDFASLMETLQAYHVEFVSCTEKFDTSTPIGRAMLNICIVFAQLERETIQQRVSDAYHSRNLKGFYMGGRIPFGFSTEPHLLDGKRTSRYRINPEEASILKRMYEIYANPRSSLADVVRSLERNGISHPRKADGKWIRNHIGRMLSNPVYVRADVDVYDYFKACGTEIHNDPSDFIGTNGCYLFSARDSQPGPPQLVVAPHEGIVDSDIWLLCRKKHTTPCSGIRRGTVRNTWLAGKIKCENCGYAMVIAKTVKKSGRSYRYFVCSHSCEPSENTRKRSFNAEEIESLIEDEIMKRLPRLLSLAVSPDVTDNQEISDLKKQTAQLECEINRLVDKAVEASGALLGYFNQRISDLDAQRSTLQSRLEALTDKFYTMQRAATATRAPKLTILDFHRKIQICDLLIRHITLGREIKVHWTIPFFESAQDHN